ncbi:hypothetical protein RJ640_023958 [Escallonia rubra]|uniref:GAG-pre-integrase domain-containing protein n=1 Tax=Escallonia rubra TaxID=112253 RepID=A0AA88R2E7_9ASTE|nr:hypothetical protein RJ640_023958 [Escallonia rubra]
MYTLLGTCNHSISLASTENQRNTLWHQRLGHLSKSAMRILHSKNALPRMKNIQLDFCEGYVYGKQKWMIPVERPGYMPLDKNLAFITLLRSEKLLLIMKHETRIYNFSNATTVALIIVNFKIRYKLNSNFLELFQYAVLVDPLVGDSVTHSNANTTIEDTHSSFAE